MIVAIRPRLLAAALPLLILGTLSTSSGCKRTRLGPPEPRVQQPSSGALTARQIFQRMRQPTPPAVDDGEFADQVAAAFGWDRATDGRAAIQFDGCLTVWAAASASGRDLTIRKGDGTPVGTMVRLAGTNVRVYAEEFPAGTAFPYTINLGAKQFSAGRIELFQYGPDSFRRPGVPEGTVTKHQLPPGKVFPEAVHDYWLYVPAQYKADTPACVMVFQDGGLYQNPGGDFRVPVVFDNLIHKGEMPVTIGVFINPGVVAAPERNNPSPSGNRSFEYDTLNDSYARFLLEEVLPEIGKTHNLRRDPASRALCGFSSGAICSWTAAWQRPAEFGKVMTHVGSFTNIRGGHVYPDLIRRADAKPIRICLQDGSNDQDIPSMGNWFKANQAMAAALQAKGYDCRVVLGSGFHSGRHGGSDLPDALRWLWRDYRP